MLRKCIIKNQDSDKAVTEMAEKEFNEKRLLILGGTSASYDLVRLAQKMGAYVIVTDEAKIEERKAKQIADESAFISTDDIDGLMRLILERHIDGIFCGPSEFNLKNLIDLCARAGLPCYATPEQWNICSNKDSFKNFCRKNNVPTAPEYDFSIFETNGSDLDIEYPLIVKPVDGCSSKGISICYCREDVLHAYHTALQYSISKKVVIEKYIDNGGLIFSFRYIIDNGEYYPYLTFDTYIADPINKQYLISAFTFFPSNYVDLFFREVNENVQKMFKDMGIKNGVAFIQAIPYKGKIYCHEMGYRLSGGMIYKITEPLLGINDMKMMLRYALGGRMLLPEELAGIQTKRQDVVMAQLMIPLCCGTIASIEGLQEILEIENVIDFLQYYNVGDIIKPQYMGTLSQHFGRFTLKADSKTEILELVATIQRKLLITSQAGEDMYAMKFDTSRVQDE